jgi:phospholipid transport system transporter-binding protein
VRVDSFTPPTVRAVDGALEVAGVLHMQSVAALRQTAQPIVDAQLRSQGVVPVDLSWVSSVDSAALALVLHWMRCARAAGVKLQLQNVPESMLALARASRMESLLQPQDNQPATRAEG